MLRIALLFLLMLSGCDMDALNRQRTIAAGSVVWDGPDIPKLQTALRACLNAPSSLHEVCAERRNEAFILLEAIATCYSNPFPACRRIMQWVINGEGRHWLALMEDLGLTPEEAKTLHKEDLETTLIPDNRFIRAIWGGDDVWLLVKIQAKRNWGELIILLLFVLIFIAIAFIEKREARDQEALEQAKERRRQERARQEEARRREQKKAEEAQRQAELEAETTALKAKQAAAAAEWAAAEAEARRQEEADEAARKATAMEEEKKAKAILATVFSPQQTNRPRPEKRKWAKPKSKPPTGNTP